jgi:pimeloyl-ACP methyl ester carboxylesterase
MHPEVVSGIVPVAMPHPTRLRRSIAKDAMQRRAFSYVWAFQLPFYPEYRLRKNDAEKIGEILQQWSGSDWPSEDVALTFRAAMMGHASVHCALEYHRWAMRSVLRTDGRRFNQLMQQTIHCPVLQIHGEDDGSISYRSAQQSEAHVWGEYAMRIMQNVGHFPHEENPEVFTHLVLDWLKSVPGYERSIEES